MTPSQKINSVLRPIPAWLLYIIGVVPPLWFLWLGLTGGLGVEPIKALEQELGELGLQALVVSLAITPLRDLTGVNLVKFRRAVGLLTFFYIFCHLLVWLILDVQILAAIWADILKRPYITVGMLGFILMIPPAITSNNLSIRKMGPVAWKRLHKLTYAAALLGAVHFAMLVKGFQIEPLIYTAIITALLLWRVDWPGLRSAVRA